MTDNQAQIAKPITSVDSIVPRKVSGGDQGPSLFEASLTDLPSALIIPPPPNTLPNRSIRERFKEHSPGSLLKPYAVPQYRQIRPPTAPSGNASKNTARVPPETVRSAPIPPNTPPNRSIRERFKEYSPGPS